MSAREGSGAAAGYSGTPLPKKLGIRPGAQVALLNAPSDFEAVLGPLPDGVRCNRDPDPCGRILDVAVLFAREAQLLERIFPDVAERLVPNGGLWIAWPKQSSPLAGPMKESNVLRIGLAVGLVDNKICAIDEDWSGLRFVYRREDRAALSAP